MLVGMSGSEVVVRLSPPRLVDDKKIFHAGGLHFLFDPARILGSVHTRESTFVAS
jgi:hypothetical protein